MDDPRRIDYLPLDEIPLAASNPKLHAVDVLDASLGRYGYIDPVVLDERTGRLIGGHGRLEALTARRDAGAEPPEGVQVDDQGRWLVPVSRGWASANDLEAAAALVTLNRTTELGGWDTPELGATLAPVAEGPGLAGVGYTAEEVTEMLAAPVHVAEHDRQPPEPREPAEVQQRVAPGDIWALGPHRLMSGSCTDKAAVDRLLDGLGPAMIVTDPPYSSGGWQEAGRAAGSIGTTRTIDGQRSGSIPQIANDRLSTRGYQSLMSAMLHAAPSDIIYVFTDWRMWVNLFDVAEASGYGVRAMIVWDKGSPGMGRGWRSQHELVLHAAKAPVAFDKHRAVGNVISEPRSGNPDHPTQKPVAVVGALIANTPGSIVYDPFAGAGTTLIAADAEGRQALVMELDPGYCDVILDRWERHGGVAPTRLTQA